MLGSAMNDVHVGERFIHLTWGEMGSVHRFEMFRRAKVVLNRVAPDLIESAAGLRHHRCQLALNRRSRGV